MKRKRVAPQNNKLNYNCRRRKGGIVEAENRAEALQGPGFHPKKQEMMEREGGSRCTGCRYWKTEKRTVRRAISVKHIFFRIYHALVSPKANLIFSW